MVVHRRDTGYLGKCLVHVLRFMLNYVVLQLIRSFVGPAQLHRRRSDVRHLHVLGRTGKSWGINTALLSRSCNIVIGDTDLRANNDDFYNCHDFRIRELEKQYGTVIKSWVYRRRIVGIKIMTRYRVSFFLGYCRSIIYLCNTLMCNEMLDVAILMLGLSGSISFPV